MERLSSNVLIRLEATACLKRFILNLWTSTEGLNNILKLKPPVFGFFNVAGEEMLLNARRLCV